MVSKEKTIILALICVLFIIIITLPVEQPELVQLPVNGMSTSENITYWGHIINI